MPDILTRDGRRLPIRTYAAEQGVTREAIYLRSVAVGEGLRQEQPPISRGRWARCLTPDGRELLLADYAAEVGRARASLIDRAGSYRRADGVWVIGAPRPRGRATR